MYSSALRCRIVSATALLTRFPGGIPQLISDNPKIAFSSAIARSQATNGVKAPPKHHPLTMAIVGLEYMRSSFHCQMLASRRTLAARSLDFHRSPAEVFFQIHACRPRLARTCQYKNFHVCVEFQLLKYLAHFQVQSGLMALRFSGRLRITHAQFRKDRDLPSRSSSEIHNLPSIHPPESWASFLMTEKVGSNSHTPRSYNE